MPAKACAGFRYFEYIKGALSDKAVDIRSQGNGPAEVEQVALPISVKEFPIYRTPADESRIVVWHVMADNAIRRSVLFIAFQSNSKDMYIMSHIQQ
jgi:hypothetical protein